MKYTITVELMLELDYFAANTILIPTHK